MVAEVTGSVAMTFPPGLYADEIASQTAGSLAATLGIPEQLLTVSVAGADSQKVVEYTIQNDPDSAQALVAKMDDSSCSS